MKAENRKQQILDAALKAFAQHGYERTSIAIVCSIAGIARPTLYQYFKDKRSLFRELLENQLIGVHEKIHVKQQKKDKNKKLSKQEALRSFHEELLIEFVENRDFYTIFFKEAKAKNAETEDIVSEMMHAMMQEFIGEMIFVPGFEDFSDEDIKFVVLYMIGGMMKIVEYYLLDNDEILSLQEIAEKMTRIESRIKAV